jgi:hypothetical protein
MGIKWMADELEPLRDDIKDLIRGMATLTQKICDMPTHVPPCVHLTNHIKECHTNSLWTQIKTKAIISIVPVVTLLIAGWLYTGFVQEITKKQLQQGVETKENK